MRFGIVSSKRYSEGIYELVCLRGSLHFEPGNCIDIRNPNTGIKKPYSIASAPSDKHLVFYIRVLPSEDGVSQYISTLQTGDYIESDEAFGYFTPGKNETDQKYVYIATGTGMSPFLSALTHYSHRPYAILCGVKRYSDVLPIVKGTNHLYKIAVSREPSNTPKHVSAYYLNLPTDKPEEYHYYICGLEEMISDATQYLIEHNVPWHMIHVEQFYYKTEK